MEYIVRDENGNQDYAESLEEAKEMLEEWFNQDISEGIGGEVFGIIYKPVLELRTVKDEEATKEYIKECQERMVRQEFGYILESNGKWVKAK